MPRFAVAYGASAAAFLLLDFVWLSYASPGFYRPRLGDLLSETPNLAIAAGFYLLYVIGVVVLAVMPGDQQQSWLEALGRGALLGLVAYGTYDITNLATIKGWPVTVSVVDLAWGVFATSVAAMAGYWALRLVP